MLHKIKMSLKVLDSELNDRQRLWIRYSVPVS